MRNSPLGPARGFVLPTTLLVTTLLTVMLTAAFILVSAEHRTTDNSLAGARALSLAQAGLQSYLAANRGIGSTTTYDSVRYTVSDGYSDVVAQRLRPAAGSSMAVWVIRSSGYSTDPRLGGQTQGKRVVAQLAQLNLGLLPARAALVSANGTQVIASGANPLSGDDLGTSVAPCVPPGGNAADTFAVSTPTYSQGGGSDPQGEGSGGGVNGVNLLASASAVIDSTRIDWASLLEGNFVPDYTIPGASLPAYGASTYNVGYVIGDATIPANPSSSWNTAAGLRGMLVVTGNVYLSDQAHWDGIIVAGGTVGAPVGAPNADYVVHGMVITGLNNSVSPGSVPVNQLRRGGTRIIRWTYCYTRASIGSLNAMVPIRNGWVDTWTTY